MDPNVAQTEPARPIAWYDGLTVTPGERRTAGRLVLLLGLVGIPAGLVWLAVAPRRDYEVVEGGFQALEPNSEALIGADGWLLLITGVLGIVVAVLVWRIPRDRGVGVLLGMALGMLVLSIVAWQVGEAIGAGSSAAEQAQLGAIVTPPLQLRAIPALIFGPFLATLTYLVMVSFVRRDDLRRTPTNAVSSGWPELPAEPAAPGPPAARTEPSAPGGAGVTPWPAAQSSDPLPTGPGDPRA